MDKTKVIGWSVVVATLGLCVWAYLQPEPPRQDQAAPAAAAPAPQAASCSLDQITLKNLTSRVKFDSFVITGEIVNNCDVPIGVQVNFATYDADGAVLQARDSWPASIRNIPAHSEFPFQEQMENQPGLTRFEARAEDVRDWK